MGRWLFVTSFWWRWSDILRKREREGEQKKNLRHIQEKYEYTGEKQDTETNDKLGFERNFMSRHKKILHKEKATSEIYLYQFWRQRHAKILSEEYKKE